MKGENLKRRSRRRACRKTACRTSRPRSSASDGGKAEITFPDFAPGSTVGKAEASFKFLEAPLRQEAQD